MAVYGKCSLDCCREKAMQLGACDKLRESSPWHHSRGFASRRSMWLKCCLIWSSTSFVPSSRSPYRARRGPSNKKHVHTHDLHLLGIMHNPCLCDICQHFDFDVQRDDDRDANLPRGGEQPAITGKKRPRDDSGVDQVATGANNLSGSTTPKLAELQVIRANHVSNAGGLRSLVLGPFS